MSKYTVIGIATGSRDLEAWHFDDDTLIEPFCQNLVRETGKSVWLIEGGELLGKFEMDDLPVKFTLEKLPIPDKHK